MKETRRGIAQRILQAYASFFASRDESRTTADTSWRLSRGRFIAVVGAGGGSVFFVACEPSSSPSLPAPVGPVRPVEGQTPIAQGRIPDASPTPLETDEQVIDQTAVHLARELGIKPDQTEATRWRNLHRQYPPLTGGIGEQQVRQYAQGKKDGTVAAMHASSNQKLNKAEGGIISTLNPSGTIRLEISTIIPGLNMKIPASTFAVDQAQRPPAFSIALNGFVMVSWHPLATCMELVLATASIEKLREQQKAASLDDILYGPGAAQASSERNAFAHAEQARAVLYQRALGGTEGVTPEQLRDTATFVRYGQNEQSLSWRDYLKQNYPTPIPSSTQTPARPTFSKV